MRKKAVLYTALIMQFSVISNSVGASLCSTDSIPKKDGLYVSSPNTNNKLVRYSLRNAGNKYVTNRRVHYHRDAKLILVGNNNNFFALKSITGTDNAVLIKSYSKGDKKREISYISAYRETVKSRCSGGMFVQGASEKYNLITISEYLAHHSGEKSDRYLRRNFHLKIISNGKLCVSTDNELDEISKPVAKFFNVEGITQIAALPALYRSTAAFADKKIKTTVKNQYTGISASLVYSPKGAKGCIEVFAPIPTWEPDRGWRIFSTTGQLAYREAKSWKPTTTDLVVGGVKSRNTTTLQIRWSN